MSPWASGDTLDSATLNARGASASSSTGYSTDTLRSESGQTIMVASPVVFGSGLSVSGARPVVAITGTAPGTGVDLFALVATMDGAGNPRAISSYPEFLASASGQLLVGVASGATIGVSSYTSLVYYGIQSFTPVVNGAGTIDRGAGVWVDDVAYATNNFAIHTGKGQNRFGDTSRFTDGSALAPSLAMDSEVSLGLYRSAASTLAMTYGTFQASAISASGNVSLMGGTNILANGGNTAVIRGDSILEFQTESVGYVALNADSSNSILRIQDRLTGSSPVMAYVQPGVGLAVGPLSPLVSSSSYGFFYMPSSQTTGPVDTPNAATGSQVACLIDPTNSRLWSYFGGAWHFVDFT